MAMEARLCDSLSKWGQVGTVDNENQAGFARGTMDDPCHQYQATTSSKTCKRTALLHFYLCHKSWDAADSERREPFDRSRSGTRRFGRMRMETESLASQIVNHNSSSMPDQIDNSEMQRRFTFCSQERSVLSERLRFGKPFDSPRTASTGGSRSWTRKRETVVTVKRIVGGRAHGKHGRSHGPTASNRIR
jgi:hypothetical protein